MPSRPRRSLLSRAWYWLKSRYVHSRARAYQRRLALLEPQSDDGLVMTSTCSFETDGHRTVVLDRKGGVQAVYELPTRTILDWTPGMVRAAVTLADSGSLRQAALLCGEIMNDDRVQGVLSTRSKGLIRLPKLFYGDDEIVDALEGEQDLARRAQAKPGDWDRMLPENELGQLVAWGVILGVGLGELVPQTKREIGERSVPRLRVWHPQFLRHDWSTDTWFLMTAEGEIAITPGDGRWILFTPYSSHRPWAQAPWRPLAFAWILKQFALHDRARASEVYGSATRVGTAPQGAKETQRRRFLSDLKAMGRDNAQVLPTGWDLKVVEATGRTWEIYEHQISWADKAISIVLAGQAITTEGTTGFGNIGIFEDIAYTYIEETALQLGKCLHDQAIRPWANVNYGDANLAPQAWYDITPPEDKKSEAEALMALGNAITVLDKALQVSDMRVDAVAVVKRFGVPLLAAVPASEPNFFAYDLEMGIVTVNEARAKKGLPPRPDGDVTVPQALPQPTGPALRRVS